MRIGLMAAAVMVGGAMLTAAPAAADENLFGYITGAETLPKGSWELYSKATHRFNKGKGRYNATDLELEAEYGVSDRFSLSGAVGFLRINTSGLLIDGYLPADNKSGPKFSGVEIRGKYNILSPAKDDFGLSVRGTFEYDRLDPHSGQKKIGYEADFDVQLQKYFMEGQLIWVGNLGIKTGHETRGAIANLPAGFEWPTTNEIEVELRAGTGISYRFAPNWFIGAETLYQSEYETEVGQERWSIFAGPTLHYGGKKMWATLTWFPQLRGGGERYEGQTGNLHLIEKTKQEVRLKVGFNF